MSISPSELSGSLGAGEKTVWHGSPPTGIMFRQSDWFLVPFSFLWFGFALFWMASVLSIGESARNGPTLIFPIVGFFFVCVGFYFAIGRFFWDAYVRRETLYALTNKRAIILVRRPIRQLRSIELSGATEVATEEGAGGGGSVIIGSRIPMSASLRGWPMFGTNSGEFVFENVPALRSVVETIRRVQSNMS